MGFNSGFKGLTALDRLIVGTHDPEAGQDLADALRKINVHKG